MRARERQALRKQYEFRCGYSGVSETDIGAELTVDHFQPQSRGGAHEPLSRADIEEKFSLNCAYGGWTRAQAKRFLAFAPGAYDRPIELAAFRG